MSENVDDTRLLSIPACADRLDSSRGHVYRLIASRQLRSVDIRVKGATRAKTRVDAAELEDFIRRSRTAS